MQNFLTFIQQHWILATLFVALAIITIIFETIYGKQNASNSVSPQEAVQLINRQDAIIVDIRKRDAFVRGHIINAIHLPLADLEKNIKKLHDHKNKPIIVVCAQGVEAAKAAKIISDNEFKDVKIIKGGLNAWRSENLPLEK